MRLYVSPVSRNGVRLDLGDVVRFNPEGGGPKIVGPVQGIAQGQIEVLYTVTEEAVLANGRPTGAYQAVTPRQVTIQLPASSVEKWS